MANLADLLLNQSLLPAQPTQQSARVASMLGAPADWSSVRPQRGMEDTSMAPSMGLAAQLIGGPALRGIRAYHGSPHKFDRFDMSKIGTGEGAQAYGHGLYFAENEGVAKAYRDQVKNMTMIDANNTRMKELAREMEKLAIPGQYRKFSDQRGYAMADEYDRLMAEKLAPGHMYEVNIRANPEQFLDWDRPLSGQPVASVAADRAYTVGSGNQTGAQFYRALAMHEGNPAAGAAVMPQHATQALREAGIPGIKYLDQGSRSAGQGSSNYVVFDDSIIDILKRYGLMGGAVAPTTAQMLMDAPQ